MRRRIKDINIENGLRPEEIVSPAACCFGLIFFMLGILSFFLTTAERFYCDRTQNVCEVQDRHIWQKQYSIKETIPLNKVESAYIGSKRTYNSKVIYFVILKVEDIKRPLFRYGSLRQYVHLRKVKEINEYLKNKALKKLFIQDSELWLFFPIPFFFVGLIISLFASAPTREF
ncbi:MAG: hypothetical protein MJ247_00445 [Alphaproteobacteria bacterium]|nr:hypothetical protein [Alphaproteobacteria bacterium]